MVRSKAIAAVSKSARFRAASSIAAPATAYGDRSGPGFRQVVGRAAVFLLMTAIGGCAQAAALWTPPKTSVTPPPASSPPPVNYSVQPRPHYRSSYRATAKRSYEAKESAPLPPATNDSLKPAPTTAQPAPTVTLADETLNKDLATKQLKQIDDKLAGLSRSQLHDLDLVSYDHAKGFATSAHKALAEGDYAAAAGLAEKASALVSSLQVKSDSAH